MLKHECGVYNHFLRINSPLDHFKIQLFLLCDVIKLKEKLYINLTMSGVTVCQGH